MLIVDTSLPKLCHARPGDVIEVRPNSIDKTEPGMYIVAVAEQKGARPMRSRMPHGLYDEERPLFLVNVQSGAAVAMPHLSSRVVIHSGAKLKLKAKKGKR